VLHCFRACIIESEARTTFFSSDAFLTIAIIMDTHNMPLSDKTDRELTLPLSHTRREMPPRRIRTWTGGFAIVAILYLAWNYSYGTKTMIPSEAENHWYTSGRAGGRVNCERGIERLQQDVIGTEGETIMNKELVPLEAHIMSKCPDAQVRQLSSI
jgi:hypothetical protein